MKFIADLIQNLFVHELTNLLNGRGVVKDVMDSLSPTKNTNTVVTNPEGRISQSYNKANENSNTK
ncbi:MAG: hypothetical protein CVU50_07870 [Candidatus Cloacimonetes bacterium HGW-Cloacimonetes-3]|jgi:hypothetical protein|nr:MAG: hypothetical protein CVU50_07870 [Candidatus Cloacimonetes bacterium HGW-Cloacimonetes-3]